MIHFYGTVTPNVQKVAILLEELGLPHVRHRVDTEHGMQREPEFLAINPNGKVPAITERGGDALPALMLWESGAILCHLAEREGRFLPSEASARAAVMQWLMWQVSALGPTGGQLAYFGRHCPVKLPIVIERFGQELHRQLAVLDHALAERDFIAGCYSIADMAIYPWWLAVCNVPVLSRRFSRARGLPWFLNLVRRQAPAYPHLHAWGQRMGARPAVKRGMAAFATHTPV